MHFLLDFIIKFEQQYDCHAGPWLTNPIPEQRPRTMENPVDTILIGTRVMRTNSISLTGILDETVELHHNIDSSHLDLQFFIIVTPNNGSNTVTTKYQ